jgi:hypothetical protein
LSSIANYSAGVLTGGTYRVSADSLINFNAGTIITSAARIILTDPNSSFPALDSLLNNNGTLSLSSRSFTTAGSLSNAGTISVTSGVLNITGPMTNEKQITVNSGGVVHAYQGLSNPLVTSPFGFINVNSGGLLLVDGTLTNTSKINMSGSGIINYDSTSPLSDIAAQIHSGFAGGSWNGIGINSTQAFLVGASTTNFHKTAVGYAEASTLGISTFAGQSVDTTAVLLRYTFSGDANIDGVVNTADFTALANRFNSSTQLWTDGDFNYDGFINAIDFNALATNFGQSLASPGLGTIIPEPLAAALLIASPLLLNRRERGFAKRLGST